MIMTIVPFLYVDLRYLRRRRCSWLKRLLWWLPALIMTIFSISLSLVKGFAPSDTSIMNLYLFLLGFIVVPAFVFMLCSLIGLGICRMARRKRNYGNVIGIMLVLVLWYILIYGSTLGFSKVVVRHVEFASADLPAAFDGYRLVHVSDLHVGTYDESRSDILKTAIDSINAQHADLVLLSGDLQNREPQELYPYEALLSSIESKDGVFSVMGNHDYADYIKADDVTKTANLRETQRLQRSFGWNLLINEHAIVKRGDDSIVIAGMENDGDGIHFPQKGDVAKTLSGTSPDDFVVMLEHDPTSWRRKILPLSHAQLTLSGHTHAMQFSLFGWSPSTLVYKEWGGMFFEGKRAINVSTGLGAFLPFRFGVPGEVVVITLRRVQNN